MSVSGAAIGSCSSLQTFLAAHPQPGWRTTIFPNHRHPIPPSYIRAPNILYQTVCINTWMTVHLFIPISHLLIVCWYFFHFWLNELKKLACFKYIYIFLSWKEMTFHSKLTKCCICQKKNIKTSESRLLDFLSSGRKSSLQEMYLIIYLFVECWEIVNYYIILQQPRGSLYPTDW